MDIALRAAGILPLREPNSSSNYKAHISLKYCSYELGYTEFISGKTSMSGRRKEVVQAADPSSSKAELTAAGNRVGKWKYDCLLDEAEALFLWTKKECRQPIAQQSEWRTARAFEGA
jgi:hypothetical protein